MKKFSTIFNWFFVWLQCHDIKGKYTFFKKTEALFPDRIIIHTSKLGDFCVPYGQWCFWKTLGPHNYYLDEMLPFCHRLNTELSEFDFFDLGADVGVVSHVVALNCPNISSTYAFEPNPKSYDVLQLNGTLASRKFITLNKAVSNFDGHVALNFDKTVSSDHEGHIDVSKPGDCEVTSIDRFLSQSDIEVQKHISIKIDVEGQELQVIEGAKNLLQQCEKAVILLEIHPDTLARDNQTPEDLFLALEAIVNVEWEVPLFDLKVDRNRDFFEQLPVKQYDVIGITQPKKV